MSDLYNIYCDESCHLEHDRQPVMLFGAVICPRAEIRRLNNAILVLKDSHRAKGELKWNKVSPSRLAFYQELIEFFFREPALRFRALVVGNKSRLNHEYFNAGEHDTFYFKMYYYLLEPLVQRPHQYHIYVDVKDTRSRHKLKFLQEVLCNKKKDLDQQLIPQIQFAPAEELHLMQLSDFLLGAVGYRNRPDSNRSQAKLACVEIIERKCGRMLKGSTPPWDKS
jgi:hypothetical protein